MCAVFLPLLFFPYIHFPLHFFPPYSPDMACFFCFPFFLLSQEVSNNSPFAQLSQDQSMFPSSSRALKGLRHTFTHHTHPHIAGNTCDERHVKRLRLSKTRAIVISWLKTISSPFCVLLRVFYDFCFVHVRHHKV